MRNTPERLVLPADLVIEILSPGSTVMDLITKRDDYERFGVGEYWAVDPSDLRIRAWRREGSRLIESAIEGERVPSAALVGFVLDVAALRRVLDAE